MGRKPKLTPTFADTVSNNGHATIASPMAAIPRIVPAHEPLSNEPFPIPVVALPNFPLESKKEQNGNTAPVAEVKPLKVALVGTAPSSRMLAPFGDLSWKIWGCSPGNQNVLPRVDAWFEIHNNLTWEEYKSYGLPYLKWLNEQTFPVYMQDQVNVPRANIFPKDELVKEFGKDFFTSSFAWMMAFAIYQGASEIGLFGIDMASRDEYILQRPGFYFFRYEAERRGIKVYAPNESDIMQSPGLYGYSDATPFGRKIHAREQELRQRIAAVESELNQRQQSLMYLKGALEDIDYFKSIWIGAGS